MSSFLTIKRSSENVKLERARVTFDEKSGIVNIKKRLRMKKSIDVFFMRSIFFKTRSSFFLLKNT